MFANREEYYVEYREKYIKTIEKLNELKINRDEIIYRHSHLIDKNKLSN